MKRTLFLAALIATPLLVQACASADQTRRTEAWSRCSKAPNPDIRDRCIQTEMALIEDRERQELESRQKAEQRAEERQAQLEAHGVPSDEARQTVESGLKVPD